MKILRLACCLLLAAASPLVAQKTCKKGIPCGNSCISATKTCHIAPTPTRSPALATGATVKADSGAAWVASSKGHTYYRAGCSGANKLAIANRIYFKTESAAQAAGLTRSKSKGC